MMIYLLAMAGFFIFFFRLKRRFFQRSLSSYLKTHPLRKNCLLTRHPLILVSGSPHLYTPWLPWGEIANLLNRHGYVTQQICLDDPHDFWGFLGEIKGPVHLFVDQKAVRKIPALRIKKPIVSVTCVQPSPQGAIGLAFGPDIRVHPLSAHLPTRFPGKLIDHVIALAERDFLTPQPVPARKTTSVESTAAYI